jgi:hypothetical protein
MSELLLAAQVDFDRPRRCPGSIPVDRNKGLGYPADPPKVEQIVAVMRAAGDDAHGRRLRGLIVILWRAGLRIQKRSRFPRPISISAAAPCSSAGRGRRASRGRHGRVGVERLQPWLELRLPLPVGPLLSTINGPMRGPGRALPRERPSARPPSTPGSGGASRPTSCGTPMPSS